MGAGLLWVDVRDAAAINVEIGTLGVFSMEAGASANVDGISVVFQAAVNASGMRAGGTRAYTAP